MIRNTDIKKRIIRKVEKASRPDLTRILKYVESLQDKDVRKKELLSFAGSWKELPKELIDDLTVNLPKKRKSRRDTLK